MGYETLPKEIINKTRFYWIYFSFFSLSLLLVACFLFDTTLPSLASSTLFVLYSLTHTIPAVFFFNITFSHHRLVFKDEHIFPYPPPLPSFNIPITMPHNLGPFDRTNDQGATTNSSTTTVHDQPETLSYQVKESDTASYVSTVSVSDSEHTKNAQGEKTQSSGVNATFEDGVVMESGRRGYLVVFGGFLVSLPHVVEGFLIYSFPFPRLLFLCNTHIRSQMRSANAHNGGMYFQRTLDPHTHVHLRAHIHRSTPPHSVDAQAEQRLRPAKQRREMFLPLMSHSPSFDPSTL